MLTRLQLTRGEGQLVELKFSTVNKENYQITSSFKEIFTKYGSCGESWNSSFKGGKF
jgi:hypothetical protein